MRLARNVRAHWPSCEFRVPGFEFQVPLLACPAVLITRWIPKNSLSKREASLPQRCQIRHAVRGAERHDAVQAASEDKLDEVVGQQDLALGDDDQVAVADPNLARRARRFAEQRG